MKNNLTTIQRIKQMLAIDKVEYTFVETVTSTGVKVRTEGDLEIGKEVFVVAEDGSETPAPDGQHILPEVGLVIETMDGKCTSIEPMEEEQSTEEEIKNEVTPEEQTAIISEVMLILDPRFEEMTLKMAELIKRIDELEASLMDGETKTEDLKTELSKFMKSAPTKSKTTVDDYNKAVKQTFTEKIEKFKRINKLR
jgi:hypothetical protein